MLRGRFEHNIDAKGRVFVPSKLREKLGEKFVAAVAFDRCVNLYSEERWEQLLASFETLPAAEAFELQRYMSSNATDVAIDAQGRILLPRHLLSFAGLEKAALIVGAGDRAEIWDPAAYEEANAQMTPEKVKEQFMKLSVAPRG
ncbi:MAG: division/cell wall cluster transcriptional repressor MraZ [Acutalibacteraceae bacterium]|jgi:MraZ protein